MPYVHIFESYLDPHHSTRKRTVIGTRDLVAAFEACAPIYDRGYRPGRQLLNYPPPVGEKPTLLWIDVSDLAPDDLVLTCTRPPLSDEKNGDRTKVPKGYTSLERVTDVVWELYFRVLARSRLAVHESLYPYFPKGYENRRDVIFLQGDDANYVYLNECSAGRRTRFRGPRSTAAYLVNQPELWKGGPRFVGFFGMAGEVTLAFAYHLRQVYSELLDRPGFHMFEVRSAPVPERVPDLKWAEQWKVELLFSAPPKKLPGNEVNSGPKSISGSSRKAHMTA